MPRGRPSTYKKDYARKLPGMMKNGESVLEVCAKLKISKDCFYTWVKKHQDFADAFTRAKELSQAWWEKQGREGLHDTTVTEYHENGKPRSLTRTQFNDRLWGINMRNRFRSDWTESAATDDSNRSSAEANRERYDRLFGNYGGSGATVSR